MHWLVNKDIVVVWQWTEQRHNSGDEIWYGDKEVMIVSWVNSGDYILLDGVDKHFD